MKIIQFNSSKMGTEFSSGKEANIFNYNDDGKDVLVKLFNEDIVSEEESKNKPYRSNKKTKLQMLSGCRDSALVTVKGLVYKNGHFVGYTMDEVEGTKVDWTADKARKLMFLKQLRQNMLRLNERGIYIGKFDDKDFLVDSTGKVIHLDIDNYSIGGIGFETKDQYMERFSKTGAKKELIDRYCFNIFTMALLGDYAIGLCDIRNMKLPISMYSKHNREVLEETRYIDENYSGKLFKLTRKDGDI